MPERPWIFVHVPKTGGTSVAASLPGRLCAYRQRDRHALASEIRALEPDLWEEALTISVVRNPWDRVVSAWVYQKETVGAPHFERWLWFGRPMLSQWAMLSTEGRVIVDHVIRFENLRAGFDRAVKLIGVEPCELLHLNPSRYREAYRIHYTAPHLIRLIAEQYPEDVREFGYTF